MRPRATILGQTASALATFAVTTFTLAGCAVGPDFHAPAPPQARAYGPAPTAAGQTLTPGAAVPADWWRGFGSAELDAMVEEALKANPDLKSADAALRQAHELLAAQRGALLPGVDASYQAQRARTSNALSPVLAEPQSPLYSLHTAQVEVSYGLDVFGGARRAVEQAAAQAEAQRFQYEAARQALIANVVAAAVQDAALRRQLDAARAQASALRDILGFTRRQAELGALGQADLAAAETTLAQAEQAVPPLVKALGQQRTALQVLLGREAGGTAPVEVDLDRLTLPKALPLTLPAALVRQRPDIRAAEANVHAASAAVGVAVAARLPNITLSAVGGGASPDLQSLFSSGNAFWTLSAGITQPIFEGGTLKHRQKAAEAALDQAKAQYRSTVLNALKNVADALGALQADADAQGVAVAADEAASRSLAFSRRQLELGQIGQLAERSAEQAAAQARSARAAAEAARFADTAALFQALGAPAAERP
ncbi:MAG TPA: efflux transporter outer membrane subunit [Caulobacteraceae bacterium]|jgi:NodT family efflux transporter outer membrane factor (OMF) lipoprotein